MFDVNTNAQKLLVCITPQVNSRRLINEAAAISARCGAELHVLNVQRGNDIFNRPGVANLLESLMEYAGEQGGIVHCLSSNKKSIVQTIADFAYNEGITKLLLGETSTHSRHGLNHDYNIISEIKKALPEMEVVIIKRREKSVYTLLPVTKGVLN